MAALAFRAASGSVEPLPFPENITAAKTTIGTDHKPPAAQGFLDMLKMGEHLSFLNRKLLGEIY